MGIRTRMKHTAKVLTFAAAVLASGRTAKAQTPGMGSGAAMPAMEDMRPVPAPEQLPVPIHMTGIGNSHITIKASAEAQVWFDQGLSLLHDFWDYESAKAFEQAIRTDPRCAMCYWGLAQALQMRGGPEQPFSEKTLAQAVRLKGKAGKTGRLYIEAADAQAHENGSAHTASIAIYRQLVKKEPHDVESRIFLANLVGDGFDDKGEPKPGEKEKIAILEAVLKDAPNDSAANHYWIHAMEPSHHPERAIASAALLASLAPNSGHMVHMPGHIYYRVGDYADADHWFAASTAVDERYMREQHVSVDDDWNYVHNLMYAIANLMEQGRLDAAGELSDHLRNARGELSASLYVWSARDQISRVSLRLPVALRIGDWNAVLRMLDSAKFPDTEKTRNLRFLQSELRSFAMGMRALDQGHLSLAQAASADMDAGLWRQGQDAKAEEDDKVKAMQDKILAAANAQTPTNGKTQLSTPNAAPKSAAGAARGKPNAATSAATEPIKPDADLDPLISTLGVASLELRAGVLLLEDKSGAAKKMFDEAVLAEKKLGYHEPPLYIRPVAETEAAALLRCKDYAGAKSAYQTALVERPASGFEMYGIARADELAGNAAIAQTEYRAFLKAWPSADANLPEVLHARQILGEATPGASK
jgi:tetratricopeptide (TPR) repeat protein